MNKLAKAVFTLSIFSVIDRVLGFVFKIYLSREMGAAGLGAYQVALSVFFVFMTFTTSGLPLIIGKLTAAYKAKGENKRTKSLVTAGLIINLLLSGIMIIIVFIFATPLKSLLASGVSFSVLLLLLPSIVFCSVSAAFRGNLWGTERYLTVSIIEVVEQIIRILLCVFLFTVGLQKANAAALSLTLAIIMSSILTAICFFARNGKLESPKGEIKKLLFSSTPISCLRASTSLVNSIQAVVIPFLFTSSGLSANQSLYWYGVTVGMALPLLYLPLTVVGSLSYAMIPTLARSSASGNKAEVKRQIDLAIKFSVLAAAIFIPLFGGLGEQCGIFVYANADAGQFMAIGACLLIPIAFESITSSMMNSLELEKQGFINYIIGSALTFGIMFCFYGRFTAEVLCVSMFVGITFSSALDILCIKKHTGASLGFLTTIIQAVIIAVPCVSLASWLYTLFPILPEIINLIISGVIGCGSLIMLYIAFGLMDALVFIFSREKTDKGINHLQYSKRKCIINKQ